MKSKPRLLQAKQNPALQELSWRTGKETSSSRMYGARWQRERLEFLGEHPMCEVNGEGCTLASNVVNHRIPHEGNVSLFWDRNNWQACCDHCHNSHVQRAEHRAKYQR